MRIPIWQITVDQLEEYIDIIKEQTAEALVDAGLVSDSEAADKWCREHAFIYRNKRFLGIFPREEDEPDAERFQLVKKVDRYINITQEIKRE